MPRKKGTRNKRYEIRRRALLDQITERLGRTGAMHASWRELAAAAGVGLATLSHYFGKRDDVILAVLEDTQAQGEAPLQVLATPTGPFESSIRDALDHLAEGFRSGGVGTIIAVGLAEGLRHPTLGPAFIDKSLEPIIQAAAHRLAVHQARREMRTGCDPRTAALALISPLLLAFLHQKDLGGEEGHPLDITAFTTQHAEAFVRGYQFIA